MFSLDSPTDGGGEFLLVFGGLFAVLGVCFALAFALHAVRGSVGAGTQQRNPPANECVVLNDAIYCREGSR